ARTEDLSRPSPSSLPSVARRLDSPSPWPNSLERATSPRFAEATGRPRTTYLISLVLPWPRGHRHGYHRNRTVAARPELEMRACGNGHAGTRLQAHGLLPVGLAPPHLTGPADDVPDFIDGMVGYGAGYALWS